MWSKLCAFAALALCCAAPAMAQDAAVRVYGPIVSIEGRTLAVTNRDGHTISFEIAPMARIVSNGPLDVRTIKAGDVIGIDEEMGKAIQAHTQPFPHGDGAPAQRKMVTNPNATRYLGVVSAAEPTANGVKVTIDLQKNGGKKQAELTNAIVHYRNQPETMAAVIPGMFVMTNVRRGDNGKLVGGFTTIEKNYRRPVDIGD